MPVSVMCDYVCGKCGHHAQNSTIFRDEITFSESLECPQCNSVHIIKKENYCYRIGWKILRDSGADSKIKQIDGVFLKLRMTGDEPTMKGTLNEQDLPPDIIKEFREKTKRVEEIVKESNILEKLEKLDVQIEHFITVIH